MSDTLQEPAAGADWEDWEPEDYDPETGEDIDLAGWLADMPADDVEIELLSGGDNVWTLRAGKEMWQVETQTCTQYPDVKGDGGELIGVFRVDGKKLVFEAAVLEPVGADAAVPPAK